MSYNYEAQKSRLFTNEGVATLLKVEVITREMIECSGSFMSGKVFNKVLGDVWLTTAALDYLTEQKRIFEMTDPKQVAGQHRVFRGRL